MKELRYYLIYDLSLRQFEVTILEKWKYNKNIELISCYNSAKIAIDEVVKKNLGF